MTYLQGPYCLVEEGGGGGRPGTVQFIFDDPGSDITEFQGTFSSFSSLVSDSNNLFLLFLKIDKDEEIDPTATFLSSILSSFTSCTSSSLLSTEIGA